MEEQTTWKGHSLTLVVFAGIVVLCSIFFILGMLVGRQQGQKIASIATAEAATIKPDATPAPVEEKPEMTFFSSVEKEKAGPALEPAPDPPASPGAGEARARSAIELDQFPDWSGKEVPRRRQVAGRRQEKGIQSVHSCATARR